MQQDEKWMTRIVEEVMDESAALAAVEGDRDLLAELAGLFVGESAELSDRLREAIEAGDAEGVQRGAHAFKGSIKLFAADRLLKLVLDLEARGRSGDVTGVEPAWTAFQQELELLNGALSVVAGRD